MNDGDPHDGHTKHAKQSSRQITIEYRASLPRSGAKSYIGKYAATQVAERSGSKDAESAAGRANATIQAEFASNGLKHPKPPSHGTDTSHRAARSETTCAEADLCTAKAIGGHAGKNTNARQSPCRKSNPTH